MRVSLKEFQTGAVLKLAESLDDMRTFYEAKGRTSSVCLSSPTGSGKTVMCAATIEALFYGDDELGLAPDERACVLWVSDSPALNDQTRARFVEVSDKLAEWAADERHLEVVRNDFGASHEVLEPRHAYFMSKDLLGRGKLLTKGGELNSGRVFWDIIDRTINDPQRNLYLFIDEAHRGLGSAAVSEAGAATIYASLIDGYEGRSAMPFVVGVSATPERFEASMKLREGRISMPRVEVSPRDVQESGLLKDTIELRVPEKDDPVEHQYLTMACERFVTAEERWDAYCAEQGEAPISPLMVVQVKDKVSDDELRELCDQICEHVPGLSPAGSFANVFGAHAGVQAGKYLIPYVEPELVQHERHVQVLFAKEAVSNGWDCPRAEVIFSQRRRSDSTYIAQLVGRMVRTPLARRIEADELLNSVACYLPQFNPEATQEVVDYLTGKTDAFGGTYVPQVIVDPVFVTAAEPRDEGDLEKAWDAYKRAQEASGEDTPKLWGDAQRAGDDGEANPATQDALLDVPPTAPGAAAPAPATAGSAPEAPAIPAAPQARAPEQPKIPVPLNKRDASFTKSEWAGIREAFGTLVVRRITKKPRNEFRSLLDTATLLADTGCDSDACADVNRGFAAALAGEIVSNEQTYLEQRREVEVSETQVITINRREGNEISTRSEEARSDREGVRRAARDAYRVFGGDELVNAYRRRTMLDEGEDEMECDLRLAAAVRTVPVVDGLTQWAADRRREYFDKHEADRDWMNEADRQRFDRLAEETEGRRTTHVEWPTSFVASASWPKFPHHILQGEDGLCPLDLNHAERLVVQAEFSRPRTLAFYRNPSNNSPQVFSIPYTAPGGRMSLRPDFIFFARDNEGKVWPTIVDPHGTHLSDVVPKLKGYVEYLREFPGIFKQVLSVGTLPDGEYRALNLLRNEVQEAILGFSGDSGEELYRDKAISTHYAWHGDLEE